MLTFEQLKKYYTDPLHLNNPKNILVEYLQCEILDSLFKQELSEKLSFMGGTAIRLCYDGDRFSEDLDFDNYGLEFKEFTDLLDSVIADMEKKGFVMEYKTAEANAFHCFIKFPKLLLESGISGHHDEKILVKIDTVLKKRLYNPAIFTLNKFDVFREIQVNPPEIILAQKLITILERKREKGRDFYDVEFLYGFSEPDFGLIMRLTGMDKKTVLGEIVTKCDEVDLKALANDVKPFLTNPEQAGRVSVFKSFIEGKIK